MQDYLIPAERVQTEIKIKNSRFICTLEHTPSIEAAHAFISDIKKTYPDARHNCWAFMANEPGSTRSIGMSDDGEPSGTAGMPMLQVLTHGDVGEISAVVTRYFGGTKLGTGGLVKAYTEAVQVAIEALPTCIKIPKSTLKASADFPIWLKQNIGLINAKEKF